MAFCRYGCCIGEGTGPAEGRAQDHHRECTRHIPGRPPRVLYFPLASYMTGLHVGSFILLFLPVCILATLLLYSLNCGIFYCAYTLGMRLSSLYMCGRGTIPLIRFTASPQALWAPPHLCSKGMHIQYALHGESLRNPSNAKPWQINPLPTIGNSLKKKSLYKVWTPGIKNSYGLMGAHDAYMHHCLVKG